MEFALDAQRAKMRASAKRTPRRLRDEFPITRIEELIDEDNVEQDDSDEDDRKETDAHARDRTRHRAGRTREHHIREFGLLYHMYLLISDL